MSESSSRNSVRKHLRHLLLATAGASTFTTLSCRGFWAVDPLPPPGESGESGLSDQVPSSISVSQDGSFVIQVGPLSGMTWEEQDPTITGSTLLDQNISDSGVWILHVAAASNIQIRLPVCCPSNGSHVVVTVDGSNPDSPSVVAELE